MRTNHNTEVCMDVSEKMTVAEAVMAGADLHLLEVVQKIRANFEKTLGAGDKDRNKLFLSFPLEMLRIFDCLSAEEKTQLVYNIIKVQALL